MIHDFVLTERHIVLLAGPAVFDLAAARAGHPLLQWRPNLGMRIGVIALDGSSVTWLEADPFFVFHFANGFERGSEIVIDYVRHAKFALGPEPGPRKVPALHRLTIDPQSRKLADLEITIDDIPILVDVPPVPATSTTTSTTTPQTTPVAIPTIGDIRLKADPARRTAVLNAVSRRSSATCEYCWPEPSARQSVPCPACITPGRAARRCGSIR